MAGTQAGQRQRRVSARQEHQVHLGWDMLEKEREHLQNGLGVDDVKIVQDQRKRGRMFGDHVDQEVHRSAGWSWPHRLKQVQQI